MHRKKQGHKTHFGHNKVLTFKNNEVAAGFSRHLTLHKKRSKGLKVTQMAEV